jgi:hypothetical protein
MTPTLKLTVWNFSNAFPTLGGVIIGMFSTASQTFTLTNTFPLMMLVPLAAYVCLTVSLLTFWKPSGILHLLRGITYLITGTLAGIALWLFQAYSADIAETLFERQNPFITFTWKNPTWTLTLYPAFNLVAVGSIMLIALGLVELTSWGMKGTKLQWPHVILPSIQLPRVSIPHRAEPRQAEPIFEPTVRPAEKPPQRGAPKPEPEQETTEAPEHDAVICANCGRQLRVDARFCDECKTPVRQAETTETEEPTESDQTAGEETGAAEDMPESSTEQSHVADEKLPHGAGFTDRILHKVLKLGRGRSSPEDAVVEAETGFTDLGTGQPVIISASGYKRVAFAHLDNGNIGLNLAFIVAGLVFLIAAFLNRWPFTVT